MDAADIISKKSKVPDVNPIDEITGGKTLVKMLQGASWTTSSGVKFTSEAPFQLLPIVEALDLIRANPERFKEGHKDELKSFYGLEE